MTEPFEIDPADVVQSAAVQFEVLPDEVREPDWTPENPQTEPFTIPGDVRLSLNLADLPDVLKSQDGSGLRISSTVAVLWQLLHSLEIRSVAGHVAVTSTPGGSWLAGETKEFAVAWDETPPQVPTGAVVGIDASVSWGGRTTARVKSGSITATGCVVQAKALFAVAPDSGQPITYHVQGLYLYTPPISSGA